MGENELKDKCHIMTPNTLLFICESCHYDAPEIGRCFLELLPTICPKIVNSEELTGENSENP